MAYQQIIAAKCIVRGGNVYFEESIVITRNYSTISAFLTHLMKISAIFRLSLAAIVAVQTVFTAGLPLASAIVVPFDGTFTQTIVQTNVLARAEQKAVYWITIGDASQGYLYGTHYFSVDGMMILFSPGGTNTVTGNRISVKTTTNQALTAAGELMAIATSFTSPNSGINYTITQSGRTITFTTTGAETRDGTTIPISGMMINYVTSGSLPGISARTDMIETIDFTPVGPRDGEIYNLTLSGATYSATATATGGVSQITADLMTAITANPPSSGTCTDMTTKIRCVSTNNTTNLSASTSVTYPTPDTTAPVVTLVGSASVNVPFGGVYTELGATWTDIRDGVGTLTGATTGSINTNVVGPQTLIYKRTDASGNTSSDVTRIVTVVDSVAPVVTLIGSGTVDAEQGIIYNDLWADWTDDAEGSGSLTATSASGSVNVNASGSYTLSYSKTDTSGNMSNVVSRTINVQDTIAPVVTLVGSGIVNVQPGSAYTDLGASWTDGVDGSGSLTATNASGSVNVNASGSYTLSYSKTDASGNMSNVVSRTINVQDTIAPGLSITTPAATVNALSYPIRGTVTGTDINTVTISGGSGALVNVTLNGSGAFNTLVPINQNSANTLLITASDYSGNSSTGSVVITTVSSTGSSFSGAIVLGSGSTIGDVSISTGTGGITNTTQIILQTPVALSGTGTSSSSTATIQAGTEIRTASGGAFNGNSVGILAPQAVSLPSNESSNGTVTFGLSNTSLYFSKPVKIEIPLSNYTGNAILIKVQHAGSSTPGTVGLTNNPNSTCTNGVAGSPSDTASVVNSIATIYTCSASTFVGYSASTVVSSGGGGGGGGAALPSASVAPQAAVGTPPAVNSSTGSTAGVVVKTTPPYTLNPLESVIGSKNVRVNVTPTSKRGFIKNTVITVSLPWFTEGSRVRVRHTDADGKTRLISTVKVKNGVVVFKTKRSGIFSIK
jgi:Domain of unknown function (DUF5011)